ncbi:MULTISPECIES: hypothetical protein [unclassified Ekhidna]|jgi:hypothetical protein|uniref:hypothetical protein n=1 Tax=unclassified Ekhidna TaxID=2632188 RepID=UPI0032DFDDCA
MKGSLLHIISILLLLTVCSSSLTYDSLIGEKERYEIEDSLEELKEGKSFHNLLFGPHEAGHEETYLILNESSTFGSRKSDSRSLPFQSHGKYILYCNLKLCC